MKPGRPANENRSPRDLGLFATRQRALESTFALAVIAGWGLSAWAFLSPRGWVDLGIGVATVTVAAFVAEFRTLFTGRT